MELIYNILTDTGTGKFRETSTIQEKILKGGSRYRTKWGLYGTVEWLECMKRDDLVETIEGVISRIYMGGHNDFPMFEVVSNGKSYEFERLGDDTHYIVGKMVLLECTRLKNVFPMSGSEESLFVITISI